MALVDLFCCNGGFSLGAHNAGFTVSTAYDLDPILTSSFEKNFPSTALKLGDIADLSGKVIRSQVGSKVTGVFGGPPCQGFSSIGRRDPNDPRRKLLGHFFRLVAELQPHFFIMENVKGLAFNSARHELDDALALVATHYNILGPVTLDAANFGAATKRSRLFIIGTHVDYSDRIDMNDIDQQMREPTTVMDAIADLQGARQLKNINDSYDTWKLKKLPNMSVYANNLRSSDLITTGHRTIAHKPAIAERFATVAQGSSDKIGRHPRLAWDGLCPTLRAGTGSDKGSYQAVRPIHPSEHRVITVREAARLQGFPDAHRFHPTTWHSFRMIGNSVSPLMAEALFRALKAKFDASEITTLAA